MTSSASRSIFCTRQGSVLIAMSFVAPMVRASITTSVSGFAWQNSALSCAFSASGIDAAFKQPALAAAAGAVPAAVGQDEVLAQRRSEDGLAFLDLELVTARGRGRRGHPDRKSTRLNSSH